MPMCRAHCRYVDTTIKKGEPRALFYTANQTRAAYKDWVGHAPAMSSAHHCATSVLQRCISCRRALAYICPLSAPQVKTLANRKNTRNGRIYKQDPTIFAFELCNECQ